MPLHKALPHRGHFLQFGDLYQPDLVPPELAQLTVPDLLDQQVLSR